MNWNTCICQSRCWGGLESVHYSMESGVWKLLSDFGEVFFLIIFTLRLLSWSISRILRRLNFKEILNWNCREPEERRHPLQITFPLLRLFTDLGRASLLTMVQRGRAMPELQLFFPQVSTSQLSASLGSAQRNSRSDCCFNLSPMAIRLFSRKLGSPHQRSKRSATGKRTL